ncbi:PREDICTED: uncharacterized protein LOC104808064 [Tarenaya hassleriana]|uniref:uncharacterized protein LOC104808064 n=1 Tax=Tarenaya hassleriana TaxID=28532 RepID=UPI00053C997B|nr:PREDICTED: uncharacterized protein LOC104808064 [Tarenaya hassleriana]XP_019057495.1 PREDICTED: uncharacterized protein LOC104808064 [Tarenaya hassleriana]
MAKVGKLTKLKSAMKRWPSFTKSTHHSSAASVAVSGESSAVELPKGNRNDDDLHLVYVGKCRRPYTLSSDIIGHPLFQELVDRSSRFAEHDREIVVACEVVLFEHLLWMLKNINCSHGDGHDGFGGGSMEELAEFYTY